MRSPRGAWANVINAVENNDGTITGSVKLVQQNYTWETDVKLLKKEHIIAEGGTLGVNVAEHVATGDGLV